MKNKDWRGYLLKLRWQAAHTLAPRREVQARGLRFTLQCDNWKTHYRWQTYNQKEPETLDWIDKRMGEGDTLFDIGANIGIYSVYAALRHPKLRVVAFEPEYANLHLFRDNILENKLLGRIEVFSVALGNASGISHLHIQDFSPGAALHTVSKEPLTTTRSRLPVVWREGIWSTTLDEFSRQTQLFPNAIKLDVDGSEVEVLEGARQTLRHPSFRTLLLESEYPQVRERCVSLLKEVSLELVWQDPASGSANQIWGRAR